MLKPLCFALALAVAVGICGCEKLKSLREGQTRGPAETVAAPPSAETAAKGPFHPPTKEEYYRMLRAGYKPPRHAVSGEGYASAGTTPSTRSPISEAEGNALKEKFGEGRKFAASGRGEEPKAPSYVEHDDEGTYPPKEFKGHD
jgi:hypothetical protein